MFERDVEGIQGIRDEMMLYEIQVLCQWPYIHFSVQQTCCGFVILDVRCVAPAILDS